MSKGLIRELSTGTKVVARDIQPGLEEANIVASGSSANTYTVKLKNGARLKNVQGPVGLAPGAAIALASYPGKSKQRVIIQGMTGGSSQTPYVVGV